MKKEKILRLDFAAQTALIFGMIMSLIYDNNGDNFAICFFSFAIVQVISGIVGGFVYGDKAKKNYSKTVFWINGIGTGLIFLLAFTVNDVGNAAGYLFVFCWMICPWFLAIWAYGNSFLGWKAASKELKSDSELDDNQLIKEFSLPAIPDSAFV